MCTSIYVLKSLTRPILRDTHIYRGTRTRHWPVACVTASIAYLFRRFGYTHTNTQTQTNTHTHTHTHTNAHRLLPLYTDILVYIGMYIGIQRLPSAAVHMSAHCTQASFLCPLHIPIYMPIYIPISTLHTGLLPHIYRYIYICVCVCIYIYI
jgi:hypothetical protein